MNFDCNFSGSLGRSVESTTIASGCFRVSSNGEHGAHCLQALHWATALGEYPTHDHQAFADKGSSVMMEYFSHAHPNSSGHKSLC